MTLLTPEQPRTHRGRLLGRPRGDAAICAVLSAERWTAGRTVADRLGKPLGATYVALWRAEQRGLIERRRFGGGYRLKRTA